MKNKLRVFRAVHRLTQEELAGKLGVTRHAIIAIENEHYDPSLSLAFRMSDLFGVPIEHLFLHEREIPPLQADQEQK